MTVITFESIISLRKTIVAYGIERQQIVAIFPFKNEIVLIYDSQQ